MLITLSRAAFVAAASVVQAKEDVRYYLNGILIEKAPDKGLLIVATDGHRLVAMHDKDAEFCADMPDSLIVKFGAESLRSVKLAKNLDQTVALEIADTDVFVSIGDSCFQDSKTIDGKFPDWRRIAKDTKGKSAGWYCAPYVADFEKVSRFLNEKGCKHFNGITFRSDDSNSAAVVYFDGAPYAFGILMPYRSEWDNPHLPQWAVGPFKKAA